MRKSLTSQTKGDRIAELFVVEERVTDKPKEHITIKEVTYNYTLSRDYSLN